jgi:hypothetical protein
MRVAYLERLSANLLDEAVQDACLQIAGGAHQPKEFGVLAGGVGDVCRDRELDRRVAGVAGRDVLELLAVARVSDGHEQAISDNLYIDATRVVLVELAEAREGVVELLLVLHTRTHWFVCGCAAGAWMLACIRRLAGGSRVAVSGGSRAARGWLYPAARLAGGCIRRLGSRAAQRRRGLARGAGD